MEARCHCGRFKRTSHGLLPQINILQVSILGDFPHVGRHSAIKFWKKTCCHCNYTPASEIAQLFVRVISTSAIKLELIASSSPAREKNGIQRQPQPKKRLIMASQTWWRCAAHDYRVFSCLIPILPLIICSTCTSCWPQFNIRGILLGALSGFQVKWLYHMNTSAASMMIN